MMTEEPYEVRSKAYYGDQLYVLFIPFNQSVRPTWNEVGYYVLAFVQNTRHRKDLWKRVKY